MNMRTPQRTSRARVAASLAAGLLAVAPLRADIVTYTNGKTLKGIVEESAADPTTLVVTSDMGKAQIPKSRVKSVTKETPAQGYVHIGEGYFDRAQYADALTAFQRALSLDPSNSEAQRQIDATQARIANENQMSRNQALQKIDEIEKQARALIAKHDFETAVTTIKDAGRLMPDPEQKLRLQKLVAQLYLAWAADYEDKLDKLDAEKMLNLALAADPTNQDVVGRMLKIWESDPSKHEQVANVYQTLLDRNADDQALRKKLADLLWEMNRPEEAVFHYLQLYKSGDQWKKSKDLTQRLVEGLDKLHLQYARQKDYDKAIYYYNLMAALDPMADPGAVVTYEYLKRASTIKPDDMQGQLALAQYAEQKGLDQEALVLYRKLAAAPETHDAAQAGIDRYANSALAVVQTRLQNGDYMLARALAGQARTDFPTATKVQTTLVQLMGQLDAKIAADTRKKEELAQSVLKRADSWYTMAMQYFNSILDANRINNPLLSSPREEAKKYFLYAIQAYREALALDPTLAQANAIVAVRLAECQDFYNRLTSPLPIQRFTYNPFFNNPNGGGQ